MALAFDRSRELSRLSGKTTQFRGLLVRDNRSRMQVLESGPQRRVSRRQNTVGLGRRAKFVVFFSVASGTPGRVYQAALAVAACKHKRLCSPRAIWAARIPCLTAYGDGATPGNPASSNVCLPHCRRRRFSLGGRRRSWLLAARPPRRSTLRRRSRASRPIGPPRRRGRVRRARSGVDQARCPRRSWMFRSRPSRAV